MISIHIKFLLTTITLFMRRTKHTKSARTCYNFNEAENLNIYANKLGGLFSFILLSKQIFIVDFNFWNKIQIFSFLSSC